MPSPHSSGAADVEYDSPEIKYLRSKDMRTVLALVDGIRNETEARAWLGAANRVGVHDRVHEAIVERVREFSE